MSIKKPKSAHSLDNLTLNIHNKSDFRHWCKELGCSDKELSAAIRSVGSGGGEIREFIESHHK